MPGNYLTIGQLPQDLLQRMEAVTLSAGTNFLSGQVTTAFAPAIDVYNNSMVAINAAKDLTANIENIGKELINMSVKKIQSEIVSYVQDKTTELLSFSGMMTYFTKSVAYHTKANLLSPGDILQKVTQKQDKVQEKAQKKAQEESINNIKSSITDKVGEIKSKVDETLGTINDGLGMITAYVTNGPKWVVTKLNSYIGLVIDKSQSFIGSQAEKIENIKQSAISNVAETVGRVAAEKINNAAISVAKDNVAKAEKLMITVQLKAMGLISKAMMMIRELTGIAVPIKLPKLNLTF